MHERHRCTRSIGVWLGLLAMAAASPAPITAQTVRGHVIDSGSGSPVSGARLVLRDAAGVVRAGVISREDGAFELVADTSGMMRLEVRHIGYSDWNTASFALASDQLIDVEVRLGVEAIPLEPIVVLARRSTGASPVSQFEARMQDPARVGGYFLPSARIAERPAATPTSLVLGAPGMSVRLASDAGGLDRSVIMSGGCEARTFIDGVRVGQGGGASVDDLLTPERIAGVEMYPRSLGAPPQYVDPHDPACGVVLYWTKDPELAGEGGWYGRRIAVGVGLLASIITVGLIG